jgi:hypothetical protein
VKDIHQRYIFGRQATFANLCISMPTFDIDSSNDAVSFALTPVQQQRVDSTFQDLFGYSWGTQFTAPSSQSEPSDRTHSENDDFALLSDMLGPTPAARILSRFRSLPSFSKLHNTGAKTVTVHKRTHAVKAQIPVRTTSRPLHDAQQDFHSNQSNTTTKSDAAPLASSSTSGAPVKPRDPAAKKPSSGGGVDVLLQQLNAPQKVSTVAKTSADWDQFKQATGLGATLEEQADSATSYLKKQDFLSRVDHRTFDLEKKDRDVQRAKRGL